MLRPLAAILVSLMILTGCGNSLQSKDKVQAAIVARLQRSSGLDLANLDVNTTSVRFDKNLAYATVAFHPKGDPNVNSEMLMKYTLEQRAGKWAVVNVGDSQGHGLAGHGTPARKGELPAGHPPLDGATPGSMADPHTPGTSQERPNGQVR